MAKVVSLVRCDDYDFERVQAAVRRAVDLLGGMQAFVKPGQHVLLKPNLLRAVPPEKAATTHPTIVAAVAKLVIEAGGHPIIVESPGGPYSPGLLRASYRKTGMAWASEVSGLELNENVKAVQVAHPEAKLLHRLDLLEPLTEVDVVINLPKLKTHNLTTLTLSVKNLFGLVPGTVKISYHAKLQTRNRFCEGLLDILTYVKPALNLMDAVVAMEGNGPSGGDPRQVSALLAGTDALAVDIASAALVGFDPLDVLTTQIAVERELTTGRLEDLELVGDPLDSLRVDDFRHGMAADIDPGLLPRLLRGLGRTKEPAAGEEGEDVMGKGIFRVLTTNWLWRQFVPMPRAGTKCIGCGFCVSHCPVGAIKLVDGIAQMDARKCIRCYCCHELCPELAIDLEMPWLGRLISRR